MEKVIRVIGRKRYRLDPKEAEVVDLVRKISQLKNRLDKAKKEYDEEKETLVFIASNTRGARKSVAFNGIDVRIRIEFPETQSWIQSKLEQIASKHGRLFFEFFKTSVSYHPRDNNTIDLMLNNQAPQCYEVLANDLRKAKLIKHANPKLRFEKVE